MRSLLDKVWAKSRIRESAARGELLTEHLGAVRDAARLLRRRIGTIPGVPEYFWDCVALACLLHDAGKIPAGFQRMVGNPGPPVPWGERHEVYAARLRRARARGAPGGTAGPDPGLGIATHHRPLEGGSHHLQGFLHNRYACPELLAEAIGTVDPDVAAALHAWLQAEANLTATTAPGLNALAEAAYQGLARVVGQWAGQDSDGLTAVLFQGAVTLDDHAASAHSSFVIDQPAGSAFASRLTARLARNGRSLFPHQIQAGRTDGHLLLRAPTGCGKTEAGAAVGCPPGRARTCGDRRGAAPVLHPAVPGLDQRHERPGLARSSATRSRIWSA